MKCLILLSLQIDLGLANSVDPDETPRISFSVDRFWLANSVDPDEITHISFSADQFSASNQCRP